MILNKNKFVCRALDNRMGGFMIAEVARLLKENKKTLPFGLYITNSVQEEIGLRGAQMISDRIKPNAAIVTDVTHDTYTPMIEKIVQGDAKIGDGPVIAYAPMLEMIPIMANQPLYFSALLVLNFAENHCLSFSFIKF